MRKIGRKKIMFLLLILFSVLAVWYLAEKSVQRTGKQEKMEIQNESNVGKIGWNDTVTQTFEADADFYGVSMLIGTFGESAPGVIRVEIANASTGQKVFEDVYFISLLCNNQYFYFASEDRIEVSEPTVFEATITGLAVLPGCGVTVWCSDGDEYAEGGLAVNGAESDGDLCFGIVYDYEEHIGAGIFAKRCMVLALVVIFLALHCFLDVSALYGFLYDKRLWVALALFVFCVANKFHGSSIGQYDMYIQQGDGSEYVEPLFGSSRAIRSDEWLVSVPRALSAEYTDYGETNDIVRATETSNLSASGLYFGYSALAKPSDWGYYLFGSEYGVSWLWSFRMIFGFLFSFELCMILSKQKKLLSLFGGTLIWFSAYNMWWSTVTWLFAGQAAIVLFSYFLREKRKPLRLLCGIGIAIFAANFVVDLYPAWQVPAGYVFLALLVWIFVENCSEWRAYRAGDWALAGGCVAFMGSVIAVYLYYYTDYMTAIMSTVYPGSRTYSGGFSIPKLFGYVSSLSASCVEYTNPSEMGCFFSFFPLSAVLFVYVLAKKRGRNLLMVLLAIPAVILGAYCLFPLPEFLAKATLLAFSMPKRAADVLGYLNMLMLITALAQLSEIGKFKRRTSVLLSGASVGMAVLYALGSCDRKIQAACVLVIGAAAWLAGTWLLVRGHEKKNMAALSGMTLLALVAGLSVNPLMYGLDAIYSKPVAQAVARIVEAEPEATWIAVDSIVTPDYLIACGARTYNSTNYVPNLSFWEKLDPDGEQEEVYNRYAHISITLTTDETTMELAGTDYIQLSLSYGDMEKLDIDYILSVSELEDAEKNGLEEQYCENGMYIYKVSEKNN